MFVPMLLHRTGTSLPRLLSALTLVLVLASCSSSSPTTPTGPTPTPLPTPQGLGISCPVNVSISSTSTTGVTVSYAAPVISGGTTPVQTSCLPASASLFPPGTTTVRCTATDALQATTSCSFTVTVAPPVPQLSRTVFLAFGDSMTAGEVSPPTSSASRNEFPNQRLVLIPSASYPTQLLTMLRARYTNQTSQLQMTNAGRPGEWAEDGAVRLPGVMASVRPQAVLLLQGVNELFALGTPGVQRASRAVDTMAREVRNRGARLFLATLPPPRGTAATTVPASQIQALNAMIRTTARGENAVLVDLHAVLSTDVTRYIGADGLHPTEAGYQKIAETFLGAIRGDLEMPVP